VIEHVDARLDGTGRILVQFSPMRDEDAYEEAKAMSRYVPGARWRRGVRGWSYPCTLDTCRKMRREWGDMLRVHRDLAHWYRLEASAAEKQVALARASNATLEVVPRQAPALHAAMGSWQRVAAQWMVGAYRNAGLLVDEPGIGKTRSVIGGLLERGSGEVLVVCPRVSVKTVWGHEFSRLAPQIPVFLARGKRAQREKVLRAYRQSKARQKVLVVVAEMLRITGAKRKKSGPYLFQGYEYPQLFDGNPWDAVIVDESQTLLGSLTVKKGNLAGEGLCRLPLEAERGLKLCVTGTPWGKGGKVEGLFGSLHFCWPEEYPSFWRWAEENFEVTEKFVGRGNGLNGSGRVRQIVGLKRTEKDFYQDLGPRILRRTMDEVRPSQHKPERWELVCEMEGLQLQQYIRMAEDAEVKVPGGILTTVGTLDYFTRARQIANGAVFLREDGSVGFDPANSGKLDVLMYNLEERGLLTGSGELKVVIASQWVEYLNALMLRLDKAKVPYLTLLGRDTDRQRESSQERFQAPHGPRIFVLSARAGGVSINLDAADELHQLDRIHPPEAEEQLHRRIRRMSRDHPVRIYQYLSEGTIEEQTSGTLLHTLMEQLRVLDGRRGLEVARDIVRYRAPKQ
jgi:SNF2 family DNA or RNA helicase